MTVRKGGENIWTKDWNASESIRWASESSNIPALVQWATSLGRSRPHGSTTLARVRSASLLRHSRSNQRPRFFGRPAASGAQGSISFRAERPPIDCRGRNAAIQRVHSRKIPGVVHAAQHVPGSTINPGPLDFFATSETRKSNASLRNHPLRPGLQSSLLR